MRRETAIADLRVLDLTRSIARYATRLLADLGADVLRVEIAGHTNDTVRHIAWWLDLGKRSVSVESSSAEGREELLRLAKSADVLIESMPTGWLDSNGLDAQKLANEHGVVIVSASPFGRTGPHASWRGTDLIGQAVSGLLQLSGNVGSPPSFLAGDQGYLHVGGVVAAAALAGIAGRRRSGTGQLIDLSMQDSLIFTTENAVGLIDLMGVDRARIGDRFFTGGRNVFPAADGWVGFAPGRNWDLVVAWLNDLGEDCPPLRVADLYDPVYRLIHQAEICDLFAEVTSRYSRETLVETAQRRHLAMASVASAAEVIEDPHLIARDFWLDVEPPSGSTVRVPGAPFKMSATPWRVRSRRELPVKAGHHDERGVSDAPSNESKLHRCWSAPRSRAGITSPSGSTGPVFEGSRGAKPLAEIGQSEITRGPLPLDGIRIVDFSWVIAGPAATQILAEHGAEVIKIESLTHPDGLRLMSVPRPPGNESPNASGIFNVVNGSKRSVTLNLSTETGLGIVRRLIRIADVIVDNYGADPYSKWGLTPESLRTLNPDLIVARASVMGRSGPHAGYIGLGNTIGAAAGLNTLSGFPGDPPVGSSTAHPDYSSNPYHLLVAILAALHYRDRSGEGQTVDLAQQESTTVFNGPAFAEFGLTGIAPGPCANRHPLMAPHGVFRCHGEDRWVAVACESDEDWRKLARVVGRSELGSDPRFASLAARKANEDELDEIVSGWTRLRTPLEAMVVMQSAGVPAGAVLKMSEVRADPHVVARRQLRRVWHPDLGWTVQNGTLWRSEPTMDGVRERPPLLGEHTDQVLGELLAMSATEIDEARLAGGLR